jgi:hypothetical protein
MWNEPVENDSDDDSDEDDETSQTAKDDPELTIPQADKRITKRKRKRQDTEQEQRPITRTRTTQTEINTNELRQLHDDIKPSEDKLFIIKKRESNKQHDNWHIVQIDWDDTNHTRARKLGVYHARF